MEGLFRVGWGMSLDDKDAKRWTATNPPGGQGRECFFGSVKVAFSLRREVAWTMFDSPGETRSHEDVRGRETAHNAGTHRW